MRIRVGIVGYGRIGQFLVDALLSDPILMSKFEIAFVWNRTYDAVERETRLHDDQKLMHLRDFHRYGAHLIVEVAHPDIVKDFGKDFLLHAHLLIGSPTAFADEEVEASLRDASQHHAVYIPSGALWYVLCFLL